MTTPRELRITTPSDREILITRAFDAPREVVFEAMTRPELLRRWLNGPPGWSTVACENDLRPSGAFRHVWRGTDGAEMSMSGVYQEVVRPERIVRAEHFDFGCDAQAGEQTCTLVLAEDGPDRTRLSLTVQFPSEEARDGALASGMEQGLEAGYDALDAVLSSKAAEA